MANDKNGNPVIVGDRIKITGTVTELFAEGRCHIQLDFCSKSTRCVAFTHQIELETPPPHASQMGEPQ